MTATTAPATAGPSGPAHPLDLDERGWSHWTAEGDAAAAPPITGLPPESGFGADEPVISTREKAAGASGRLRSRPFAVTHRYLEFRTAGGDHEFSTAVNVVADGRVIASETGRRSETAHAAAFDLGSMIGRVVHVEIVDVSHVAEPDRTWSWIRAGGFRLTSTPTSAAQLETAPLYRESLRPRVHFTARQWAMRRTEPLERQEGWLNDLNGLVFFDGEYHLFAQRWNKCWIHAVSTDLVHWTELEPAFFEEALETGVQSGSCVVDVDNTSGLGDGTTPPMVAFWSRNDNRTQCLSYSLDHGRTWTHWAGNPLMDFPERDPMVFRDHARDRWTMVLYGDDRYHFLVSDDLLHWSATGATIDDSFECPDFFELPIDGEDETRWVLVRGDGRYSLGAFDGAGFAEQTGQLQPDVGASFYATQSWAAGTGPAPRRVQTAWMRGSTFPQMPFNQQVSLPCELTLRRTSDGLRVFRRPVAELETLETRSASWSDVELADGATWRPGTTATAARLRVAFELDPGAELDILVSGSRIVVRGAELSGAAGTGSVSSEIRELDVVVDVASIEVFVNGGELSATTATFAGQPDVALSLRGGGARITTLSIAELASIWP